MFEEFEYEVEHRAETRLKHVLSQYLVMAIKDKVISMIKKQQDGEEKLRVIKKILETGRMKIMYARTEI